MTPSGSRSVNQGVGGMHSGTAPDRTKPAPATVVGWRHQGLVLCVPRCLSSAPPIRVGILLAVWVSILAKWVVDALTAERVSKLTKRIVDAVRVELVVVKVAKVRPVWSVDLG